MAAGGAQQRAGPVTPLCPSFFSQRTKGQIKWQELEAQITGEQGDLVQVGMVLRAGGVHPALPNPSPPSLAAEAGAELLSTRGAAGTPSPSATCSEGREKLIMQVGEVLSTHGVGLGFLASFLGFMKRSEVWPEPAVPMGWGSLFGYLWGFGIQEPGPGSSD